MPDALRPGQEVIVTAIPLYHIFALMVNFITYFSVGSDNWLVPNPRDFDAFIDTLKKVEDAGFHEVILYFNVGLKPHQQVKDEMERFMREVAPAFDGAHKQRAA